MVTVIISTVFYSLESETRANFKCCHPYPQRAHTNAKCDWRQCVDVWCHSTIICGHPIIPPHIGNPSFRLANRISIIPAKDKHNSASSVCQLSLSRKQKPHWRLAMWSCHPLPPPHSFQPGPLFSIASLLPISAPVGLPGGSLYSMDSLSAIVSQYQFMVSRIQTARQLVIMSSSPWTSLSTQSLLAFVMGTKGDLLEAGHKRQTQCMDLNNTQAGEEEQSHKRPCYWPETRPFPQLLPSFSKHWTDMFCKIFLFCFVCCCFVLFLGQKNLYWLHKACIWHSRNTLAWPSLLMRMSWEILTWQKTKFWGAELTCSEAFSGVCSGVSVVECPGMSAWMCVTMNICRWLYVCVCTAYDKHAHYKCAYSTCVCTGKYGNVSFCLCIYGSLHTGMHVNVHVGGVRIHV